MDEDQDVSDSGGWLPEEKPDWADSYSYCDIFSLWADTADIDEDRALEAVVALLTATWTEDPLEGMGAVAAVSNEFHLPEVFEGLLWLANTALIRLAEAFGRDPAEILGSFEVVDVSDAAGSYD
jgi:hypothetical protein